MFHTQLCANFYFEGNGVLGKNDYGEGEYGGAWLTPWVWSAFRLSDRLPFTIRAAFKIGEFGDVFGVKDREIDFGLSGLNHLKAVSLGYVLSYRIRTKATYGAPPGPDYSAGNEVLFKLEPSFKLWPSGQLTFLMMGYRGGDRKQGGQFVPNSDTNKLALGAKFSFRRRSGAAITLGGLVDISGKYDHKSFSFIFEFTR